MYPQGLKATALFRRDGTAEAVPLQVRIRNHDMGDGVKYKSAERSWTNIVGAPAPDSLARCPAAFHA